MFNLDLKYIPSQEIINELKNELSTYFEKGMLDESFLYPVIRTCLSKMSLKILPVKRDVIKLEEGKAELPCDFYKMDFAVGCGFCDQVDVDYLTPQFTEYEVSAIPVCKTECDYCSDECGNLFQIVQHYNTFSATYSNLFPLTIKASDNYCTKGCSDKFGSYKHKDEITIREGYVYANFKNGWIYIEYMTNLESDDGDLLIPDQQTIKDWIKHEMMFVCFKKLYLNQEGDFIQRLEWVKSQLSILQVNAQSIYKRWEVREIYDLRKVLRSRYHKYNTAVYGRYYDSPLSLKGRNDRGYYNNYDFASYGYYYQ